MAGHQKKALIKSMADRRARGLRGILRQHLHFERALVTWTNTDLNEAVTMERVEATQKQIHIVALPAFVAIEKTTA